VDAVPAEGDEADDVVGEGVGTHKNADIVAEGVSDVVAEVVVDERAVDEVSTPALLDSREQAEDTGPSSMPDMLIIPLPPGVVHEGVKMVSSVIM